MHDIILMAVMIPTAYFLYAITMPLLRPLPPKANAILLRRRLRSQIRTGGIPRLCGYHTGAMLRPGQLAIIDSARCETCIKEGKSP